MYAAFFSRKRETRFNTGPVNVFFNFFQTSTWPFCECSTAPREGMTSLWLSSCSAWLQTWPRNCKIQRLRIVQSSQYTA